MPWSLRQLEVFLAVLEEGGFSAAGERVGMVQPAVSIAIRKLEQQCGVRLLERSGHSVRPTREGEVFLAHARTIHSQIATLDRELKEMRALDAGHVTIGAPPLISSFMLPRITRKFLSMHPGIRLTAVEASSESIVTRLRAAELDVAVLAGHHDMEGLETILIDQHPVVACVPAASPLAELKSISWQDLFNHPLALFSKGYNQRSLVDGVAAKLGRSLHIAVEADSARFLAAMVAGGHGVSVTFAILAKETPGVTGIPISEEPTIPVFLARRQGAAPSIAASAFFAATATPDA